MGDIPRLNARRYPDKKALVMEDQSLTYSQFNDRVNLVANGLLARGVASGDRVAVLAMNRLDYPVLVYAALKIGAVVVPVNFRYQQAELAYALNDAAPKVMFFSGEMGKLVAETRGDLKEPIDLVSLGGGGGPEDLTLDGLIKGRSPDEPKTGPEPSWPAMIMYTSGTTGFPKGVIYSHGAYMNVAVGLCLEGDLGHNDVSMVCLPLFHNGGLNAITLPTLLLGGTVVIMAKGFDPDIILEAVGRHRVTMTMWVPTMLAILVNHPGAAGYDVSSLNKIWYGSSAISPIILEASQKMFGAGFYQWYGQTETGMNSVLRPEDHAEHTHCTGREMFNSEIRIIDEEGNDTPVGEVGEIICAQKLLGMSGYWNMPEATEQAICEGWIHTGDLARVEGGSFFTVVDRIKDMIISGAENIYPKEIEDLLMTHAGVREVAVIGIPDEVYGESVCAVVVKKKGQDPSQEELIGFCAERLARYKKPKKVVFIDELPKNAAGKVTKNPLREPFWADRGRRV
jgi:acyl-CoA synthetase (AMP-forming)/AMP-acid ligase II